MTREELERLGKELSERVKADPFNWEKLYKQAIKVHELTKEEKAYLLLCAFEAQAIATVPRVEVM